LAGLGSNALRLAADVETSNALNFPAFVTPMHTLVERLIHYALDLSQSTR
jgi:hypothetical protein